jgi:hypothetical protein
MTKFPAIAEPTNIRPSAARWRARVTAILSDQLTLSLALMFVIGAAFYLWTAATSDPLSLSGNHIALVQEIDDDYNQLATAFLHLHLSIGAAPAGLVHLANPYDPSQNGQWQTASAYHDLSLYHGRFYLIWGPAPVLVLFVPLHVLDLAPSTGLTLALFGIAGLAFALATLRVLLREFDAVPLWMGILAAACSCARRPFRSCCADRGCMKRRSRPASAS